MRQTHGIKAVRRRGKAVDPSPVFQDGRERREDGAARERAQGANQDQLALGARQRYVQSTPVSQQMADGALCV